MSPTSAAWAANEKALMDNPLTCDTQRRRLERAGRTEDVALLNVSQFATLFNFDLSCLIQDLNAGKNSWHAKLHARHLVLTMYECVDDFMFLLGRDFRALVARRTTDIEVIKELNELHRALREFRDEHYEEYDRIRDGLVAHREHNAQVYVERLAGISVEEIEAAAYKMIEWLTRLYRLMTSLIGGKYSPGT